MQSGFRSKWTRNPFSLSFLALFVAACLVGSMPGCASSSSNGAIEVEQVAAATENAAPPEYVIRPGDLLSVQVYSDEKASGRPRVRSDGRISLPLLNDIEA